LPLVGVIMGSASDEPVVQETVDVLEQLHIDYEVRVMSAHRTPERVQEYAQQARDRGIEVLISAAGSPRLRCLRVSPWPAWPWDLGERETRHSSPQRFWD